MMNAKKQSAWRSPWVWTIIGFFLVFLSANIYMLTLAGDSSPRLVNQDYYKRGEDYEENMLKRMAKDPGWVMKIEAPEFIDVAVPTTFVFTVFTKEGEPVDPDLVTFYAYRPSDGTHDFSQPMSKEAAGRYQTEVSFPLKGVWDILIAAKQGEEEYQTPYRFSAGVK
jgi:nitrogen fixation protein FixH